jgi:hypothetical protein
MRRRVRTTCGSCCPPDGLRLDRLRPLIARCSLHDTLRTGTGRPLPSPLPGPAGRGSEPSPQARGDRRSWPQRARPYIADWPGAPSMSSVQPAGHEIRGPQPPRPSTTTRKVGGRGPRPRAGRRIDRPKVRQRRSHPWPPDPKTGATVRWRAGSPVASDLIGRRGTAHGGGGRGVAREGTRPGNHRSCPARAGRAQNATAPACGVWSATGTAPSR